LPIKSLLWRENLDFSSNSTLCFYYLAMPYHKEKKSQFARCSSVVGRQSRGITILWVWHKVGLYTFPKNPIKIWFLWNIRESLSYWLSTIFWCIVWDEECRSIMASFAVYIFVNFKPEGQLLCLNQVNHQFSSQVFKPLVRSSSS